ncbi:hypothetical protein LOY94_006744 [Ophidiomyces ophidiicola]|nr:hypothetical protein LOZ56_006644 [Ophidiomyces ophidiicola]KAI2157648.1 hypothetical protein LOZ23_005738 [Ophidiomyces ophidiicola]KAI2175227.1 hypothetical protein LOZ22_005583 [Ophidiomyces ophidiicola]KAI2279198.1 hypothetical protein LOZ02_005482 [Ophidiomyces ophidiicola]KAI2342441.1 hypothetical protein LOY94_006744 [Ophidiomyces ophidiicola]
MGTLEGTRLIYKLSQRLIFSGMENWGTSKFKTTDLGKGVTNVHICGYKNEKNEGDLDGRPPTNHWAAFLEVHGGGSVRLDMVPGDGADGLTGMLIIESKVYSVTNNASKSLFFTALGHATVKTITDLISSLNRDKYRFTEHEEGCRYWIYTFISDLEGAGIIGAGSNVQAWNSLSRYWCHPAGSGSEARVVEKGAFL